MRIFSDGQKISDNLIKKFKGNGNFAEVYHAYNEGEHTDVALKVSYPNIEETDKGRFIRENEILHKLKAHDNIIKPLSTIQTYPPHTFYLMELADSNLPEYIFSHTLSFEEKLIFFKKICIALQYAHINKVVHRDLWWNNILIKKTNDLDIPKVSDFGRAKDFDAVYSSDIPLGVWGHLYVCPPEIIFKIWSEQELDNYLLTDIYALGINLYYLFYDEPAQYLADLRKSYILYLNNKPEISSISQSERVKEYNNWLSWVNSRFPQIKLSFSLIDGRINQSMNNILNKLCCLDHKKRYHNIEEALKDLDKI